MSKSSLIHPPPVSSRDNDELHWALNVMALMLNDSTALLNRQRRQLEQSRKCATRWRRMSYALAVLVLVGLGLWGWV